MAWAPIVAGGVMSLISGMMSGDKESMQKFQTLTPQQKQFMMSELNQLQGMQGQQGGMGQGMNILQKYLDPNSSVYKNFEQPYRQEFEQQTIPKLAERFAGAGGGQNANSGALSSSGFGQALGSAGANLQTNLAEMKSKLQQGAIKSIFDQYNNMASRSMGQPGFGLQQQGASPWQTGLASAGSGLFNAGLSNWSSGNSQTTPSYQAQYPLTSQYAMGFQTGGMT